MTTETSPAECPHGDPRPKRCALCRRDRRRNEEAAKLRTALDRLPDAARAAANDREDD